MQQIELTPILLVTVSILTFLSGFSVFIGSTRKEKASSAWFFAATLGAAIWSISIMIFLSLNPLDPKSSLMAPWLVFAIFLGVTIDDVALLGYIGWKYKTGKFLTILFMMLGSIILSILVTNPSLLYSEITFGGEANRVVVLRDWYYFVLLGYFTLLNVTFSNILTYTLRKTKNHNSKVGLTIFLISLSVAGILALIFDLLQLSEWPATVWIGPLASGLAILIFYYCILKYRMIVLSARWLKILSYFILLLTGGALYILVFFAIFTALFKFSTPSVPVLVLNLLMGAIILCLVPAIAEVRAFMKSLIATKQIDVGYATKKIERIAGQKIDLKELAGFLATHFHSTYVGFLINGRLYGCDPLELTAEDFRRIEKFKSEPDSIWQILDGEAKKTFADLKLIKTAKLIDEKGRYYGQIIIGKPLCAKNFDQNELIKIEMLINLTATIVASGKKIKV